MKECRYQYGQNRSFLIGITQDFRLRKDLTRTLAACILTFSAANGT